MSTVNSQNQVSQSLLNTMNSRSSTSNTIDAAQDRFMTLLVTQMKNQDPLNPMDNAQVTSQMAQLNTVTGINKLNDTMGSLIQSVQLGQSYQATSMIGHNVLVAGNSVTNASSSASSTSSGGGYFGVNLPNGADSVTVNIKNGAGQTIRTLTYDKQAAGSTALQWDGKTDAGVSAATGNYTFEVSAKLGSSTTTATGLSVAQVQSVSNQSGSVKLNLSNNTSVSTSDVVEIF